MFNMMRPLFEPIIIARKPVDISIIDNIIKWEVGGINIDECKIGNDVIQGGTMPDFRDIGKKSKEVIGIDKLSFGQVDNAKRKPLDEHIGRFPANTILTYNETDKEEVISGFPYTKSTGGSGELSKINTFSNTYNGGWGHNKDCANLGGLGDDGLASRYFKNCQYSLKDIEDDKIGEDKMEEDFKIINGNMLEELEKLEDNSVDAIITDPPYELGFMNKDWDSTGIAFNKNTWRKCLRVLKPRWTFIGIWWKQNIL